MQEFTMLSVAFLAACVPVRLNVAAKPSVGSLFNKSLSPSHSHPTSTQHVLPVSQDSTHDRLKIRSGSRMQLKHDYHQPEDSFPIKHHRQKIKNDSTKVSPGDTAGVLKQVHIAANNDSLIRTARQAASKPLPQLSTSKGLVSLAVIDTSESTEQTAGVKHTTNSTKTQILSTTSRQTTTRTPSSPWIRKVLTKAESAQLPRTVPLRRKSDDVTRIRGIPTAPHSSRSSRLSNTPLSPKILHKPHTFTRKPTAQEKTPSPESRTYRSHLINHQLPGPHSRRTVLQLTPTPLVVTPRLSNATTRVPSSSEKSPNPKPLRETHLHLDEEESIKCFTHTKYDTENKKTHQFYKEISAQKGSVVGEILFDKEQLKRTINYSNRGCSFIALPLLDVFCCALRVRIWTRSVVAVEVVENANQSSIILSGSGQFAHIKKPVNKTKDNFGWAFVFVGTSQVVDVTWQIGGDSRSLRRFVLRFQKLEHPGLQVERTGRNTGIVQTPLYQSSSFLLNRVLNPSADVRAPPGHAFLVSFPKTFQSTQLLSIKAGDRNDELLDIVYLSVDTTPTALIYNTTLLRIVLRPPEIAYADIYGSPGFRLYFSFLRVSILEQLLPGFPWNCSVPYQRELLYHLSCNLRVDCHDAADESDCSYTTDACGPRYVTLGGACFFYVRRQAASITWNHAAHVCARQGGRLAILDSPEKWEDILAILPYDKQNKLNVFLGIRPVPHTLPLWYSNMFRWVDGTTAFYLHSEALVQISECNEICGYAAISTFQDRMEDQLNLRDGGCNRKVAANILCEKTVDSKKNDNLNPKPIVIKDISGIENRGSIFIDCPLGHYTFRALACDAGSSCWLGHESGWCESPEASILPTFACANHLERVSYTFVCDFRNDCSDGSDEGFCIAAPCMVGYFACSNKQCIPRRNICDGWKDCSDEEDELTCVVNASVSKTIPPPAVVTLSDNGRLAVGTLQEGICPNTHFQCPDNGYCLPAFLRCNGVYDCSGFEDESGCDTCPGLYRCRDSKVCLFITDLCDGRPLCPKHDDELCLGLCPDVCKCWGLAFFCTAVFTTGLHSNLRFLDATSSGLTPARVKEMVGLVHLSLANCGFTSLGNLRMPNLLFLNVKDNRLTTLGRAHLAGLPQLSELYVAGNPLVFGLDRNIRLPSFPRVVELDLSRVRMHVLNATDLSFFPNLRVLNLSHTGLERVASGGFSGLKHLCVIDLRGCPMTMLSLDLFKGLSHLEAVHAHTFKVCCPAVLPIGFNSRNCFAPSDEISSCDDMLRETIYKVGVFVLALLAIVANGVSFIFRTCVSKRESQLGYGNFVTHLSVSDFLMGIYLAIVGVADQVYHGTYFWKEGAWRHSGACTLAGFLSLLSSEVSALIMSLITLDRFLVLRFPFSRLHFSARSAHTVSGVVWIGVAFLASLPLASRWEFYSQTGICIPLPVTRHYFVGHDYSFGILIIFNFIVFIFISLGQLSIYWSIHTNSITMSNSTKKNKDLSVARRLITVAMTDFLCWFPIGLFGLLASSGVPILGEINVALAIFVLPLNSAVNPCLYTLNVISERRNRAREEKLRAALLARLKTSSD